MKLLIIARHPGGGIKTYLKYIFQNPVMQDLDVLLVTPKVNDEGFFYKAFKTNSFEYWQSGSSFHALTLMARQAIKEWQPDVMHSHGFTAGIASALPCKLYRVPHILTTHDVFLPNQSVGFKGWLIGRLLGLPDVLNPVGRDAAENLLKTYPFLENKTEIKPIRNGIDSEFFLRDDRRALRSELGLDNDVTLVGFFGRFMAQKGFVLLRDAIIEFNASNSGNPIHVACFGWGGFIREEQEALEGKGVSHWFHFLPGTDDMVAALRGVDAAVMPSRWEACPLLPMEALVAGTVVIASDCIGMKEVLEDTPALVFPSGDVGRLVEALGRLVSDKESLCERSYSFRTLAAERFDCGQTAKSVRALYNSMVC